jgi:hypothetical protein
MDEAKQPVFAFPRKTGRQWGGNGFGTSRASYYVVKDGKIIGTLYHDDWSWSVLGMDNKRVGWSQHYLKDAKEKAQEWLVNGAPGITSPQARSTSAE